MKDAVRSLLSSLFDGLFGKLREVGVPCRDVNGDELSTMLLLKARPMSFVVEALSFFGDFVGCVENFRIVCHVCFRSYCNAKETQPSPAG